jgi:uncharacterized protein (DUF39 family)
MTSAGPECIGSWAVPIPVLNESILENIKKLDRDISLPIMDVNLRETISKTNYGDVWDSTDLEVKFNPSECIDCKNCTVISVCPMRATIAEGNKIKRDKDRCFNCGLCISQCIGKAFTGNLGKINFEGNKIPILLRQSDRARAIKLADLLKLQILNRSFKITQMVEHIST